LLSAPLGQAQAARWTAGAAAALAYLLWELRRNLGRNFRPGETAILPTLGAGTALTLARGLFCALLTGFLLIPEPSGWPAWTPPALYFAAAVADFFDGYMARVRNHATKLGASLDVAFDALGVMVAVSVLVHHGRLSPGFLAIGLVYYLFHAHMKLRARLGRPMRPLRPSPYRRMYAGFLYGYFAVALIPAFPPAWVAAGGYLFVAPVLIGFAADWLFMTGAVNPDGMGWARFEAASMSLLYGALPIASRGALLPFAAVWLNQGRGGSALATSLLTIATIAALGMTTAGWLGRLGALMLITLACLDVLLLGPPTASSYALLFASTGVLLLGTGRGVLWGPEDALLLNQAGARRTSSRVESAAA
jgi:CDP-diacylglycerol--glycerol-3-phosphate 3-phosphatidyltransferase